MQNPITFPQGVAIIGFPANLGFLMDFLTQPEKEFIMDINNRLPNRLRPVALALLAEIKKEEGAFNVHFTCTVDTVKVRMERAIFYGSAYLRSLIRVILS